MNFNWQHLAKIKTFVYRKECWKWKQSVMYIRLFNVFNVYLSLVSTISYNMQHLKYRYQVKHVSIVDRYLGGRPRLAKVGPR